MMGFLASRFKKAGLPPGTPVYVGEKRAEEVRITVIDYDAEHLEERTVTDAEECFAFREKPSVTWINVTGLHEVGMIEKLGKHFGLHPLVIEDIVHTRQRPKLEVHESHIFIVLRMHRYRSEEKKLDTEQVSIIAGENFVLTFLEREGDIFDPVRDRIHRNVGRIRRTGADYLAYALMDAIVDNYFVVLENAGEWIDELDEALLAAPGPDMLESVRSVKRQMIHLRKSVWPLREVIGRLEREGLPLIRESTRIYLRDLYDHTIQVIETVETFRDMAEGMFDLYLSSISNRMNEIMKVLTIFATIFIPLTFIAGVYGMNFEYMPELRLRWGYFGVLGLMGSVAVALLIMFRMKKWL